MDDVASFGAGHADTPLPIPPASTLVLHSETSRQRRWALKTALDLVKSLSARQEKVVVADLHRSDGLADVLEMTGGAGIVDVLFRGTSFSVVARRPEAEDYYFLSIGTNPPPVQVIYSHPQWKKIAARLPEARAHLLACVPWTEWMEAGPIPGFEASILLNGVGSDMPSPTGAREIAEYVAPPEIRDPALATPVPGMETREPEPEEEEIEPGSVAGFMTSQMDATEESDGGAEESGVGAESADEDEFAPEDEFEDEPFDAAAEDEEWAEPVAPEPWADAAPQGTSEPQRPASPGLGRSVGGGRAVAGAPGGGGVGGSAGVGGGSEPLWPDSYANRREGPFDWVRRRWPILAAAAVLVAALGVWRVLDSESQDSPASVEAAAEPVGETTSDPDDPATSPAGQASEPAASPGGDDSEDTVASAAEAASEEASDEPGPEEPAAPEPPPEARLAYSVVIASFSSFDDAMSRQRRWSDRETQFYVAPTVVRGVVYYRVFAGLLPERPEAEALAERLVERGIKESSSAWDIRPTQLAFHFGTYESRREATSTVETLEGKGVPAYIVPAAAVPDEEAYHVYAGGYERAEEASPLRQQIEEAGLDADLVERVGMLTR